jgi:hypothetical protein
MTRLREAVQAEGGLLAQSIDPLDPTQIGIEEPGDVVAAGPRARGHAAEYRLVVDLIREGDLLHGDGRGRVVSSTDPDLALLLGDQLYALGLNRLAELGDLEAVTELADLIALCAQARVEESPDLADAAWRSGPVAVGWGGSPALDAAKEAARAGDRSAPEQIRRAGRELAQHR